MIAWTWLLGKWAIVPTKWKIYGGLAVVFVAALFRWRAAGIRAAVDKLKEQDEERANEIRERAEVARRNEPSDRAGILKRLRKYDRLRSD